MGKTENRSHAVLSTTISRRLRTRINAASARSAEILDIAEGMHCSWLHDMRLEASFTSRRTGKGGYAENAAAWAHH